MQPPPLLLLSLLLSSSSSLALALPSYHPPTPQRRGASHPVEEKSWSLDEAWVETASDHSFARLDSTEYYFLGNGNLLIMQYGRPVWDAGVSGDYTDCAWGNSSSCSLQWQADGNLVIRKEGRVVSASGTNGQAAALYFDPVEFLYFRDAANHTMHPTFTLFPPS